MPFAAESASSRRFGTVASTPVGPTPFACDVFPERGRVRVAPRGELDIATTSRLEHAVRELLESGFDDLLLDLTNVEFLDSTGLRLLLVLQGVAAAGGCRFRLKPGPPAVQRIFELTGTLDLFEFETPVGPPRHLWVRR